MGGRGGASHRASGGGLPKTLARFAELQRTALDRIGTMLSRGEQQYIQSQLQLLFAQNDFGMRVRNDLVEVILDTSFKSQFETHTSGGMLDEDFRVTAARNLFGVDTDTLKPSEHEKYGYMMSRDKVAAMSDYAAAQYGDTAIRFKREAVMDRLTYTVGDSLGPAYRNRLVAGSVKDASITGFPDGISQYVPRIRAAEGQTGSVENWSRTVARSYFELQYHGKLTMDHVESVTFGDTVPWNFSAVVEKLKKRGISVWRVTGGRAREL